MKKQIQPDFSKCAVLNIDMQNDFVLPGAVAEVKGTYEVIPQIKSILETCRTLQIPIIHVIRIYLEDGTNAEACRRSLIESGTKMVTPGSKGADLVASLKPVKTPDLVIQPY